MQTELLQQISSAYSAATAETTEERDRCCGAVLAFQQQLSTVANEHIKQDTSQTEGYSDLLRDVSAACASSLGTLCACEPDVLRQKLPAGDFQEGRDATSQAPGVLAVLPLAIAVLWHCSLEERASQAMCSVDMLRPSQRLPPEKRAPLICGVQVTIIAGHVAVAAKAICGAQVCHGSDELKVEADSHPMMRFMMQKLFYVSQAFNKSGRSKLLVPIDVALESHFADDKIMKVHLPLMRRGFAAEDAWQAFKEAGEAQPCDSGTPTPSSAAVTKEKENKSKASASTRTGQTLRRTRSEPLPAAGAALAAKSLRAKARGLHRSASAKRSKHVIRTHHHLVPRMAMPTQVTQKCMPNIPVAKRMKQSSRRRGACPLSVIPDTEKVTRDTCWGTCTEGIKKRLDFHAFEDAPVDHGVLRGVTAEDFAMFPAMDLPVIAERKKTIFEMH